jgi:superfamily II DNA or RNA helicase
MRATIYDHYWMQLDFVDDKERELLNKSVSYEIPGAIFTSSYKLGLSDGTKSYLTAANKLPIGIFKSLFPEHSLVYDTKFTDITFDDIPLYVNNSSYERRDYQLEAINNVLKHKRGLVNSVVGSGKSLIAAATISYLLSKKPKTKVLFIVYDKNILSQTLNNFKKYGFTQVTQYGDSVKNLSGDIIVGTIQSLSRIQNPKKVLADITCCFVDESHHTKSRTSKEIIKKLYSCNFFIGLTGTVPKDKSLARAEIMALLGPVIFKFDMSKGVEQNNIAPVKCIFYKLPYNEEVKSQVIDRKNYKHIWDKAICESKQRNKAITDILKYTIALLETPGIVLVDRVLHGNELANNLLSNSQIKLCQMYGADNVVVRELKKEALMKDNINVIISSVLGEGVDLRISPVIAINAAGRKNFIQQIQFLGRIVRSNEKFGDFRVSYDIYDTAHPMLRKHSEERLQNCKDTGSEVVICETIQEVLKETVKYFIFCKNKNKTQ